MDAINNAINIVNGANGNIEPFPNIQSNEPTNAINTANGNTGSFPDNENAINTANGNTGSFPDNEQSTDSFSIESIEIIPDVENAASENPLLAGLDIDEILKDVPTNFEVPSFEGFPTELKPQDFSSFGNFDIGSATLDLNLKPMQDLLDSLMKGFASFVPSLFDKFSDKDFDFMAKEVKKYFESINLTVDELKLPEVAKAVAGSSGSAITEADLKKIITDIGETDLQALISAVGQTDYFGEESVDDIAKDFKEALESVGASLDELPKSVNTAEKFAKGMIKDNAFLDRTAAKNLLLDAKNFQYAVNNGRKDEADGKKACEAFAKQQVTNKAKGTKKQQTIAEAQKEKNSASSMFVSSLTVVFTAGMGFVW